MGLFSRTPPPPPPPPVLDIGVLDFTMLGALSAFLGSRAEAVSFVFDSEALEILDAAAEHAHPT